MNRFAATFAVGIGLIAIVVAGVLFMQRGARVGLTGKVLKVRTAPIDEHSSIVVVDFRFTNPADVFFVVQGVTLVLEGENGNRIDGTTVSEMDAKRLFEAIPLLGQKYTDTLIIHDRIAAHASQDRMVAARFEVPEADLAKRKQLLVRVEDVDGPVSELSEK